MTTITIDQVERDFLWQAATNGPAAICDLGIYLERGEREEALSVLAAANRAACVLEAIGWERHGDRDYELLVSPEIAETVLIARDEWAEIAVLNRVTATRDSYAADVDRPLRAAEAMTAILDRMSDCEVAA